MSISLNDHEIRIKALENNVISNIEIDCGKVDIPSSNNGYNVRVSFNRTFTKVPSVAMNGSLGQSSGGMYSEGSVISEITTTGFTYDSQWEKGWKYIMTWIAIAILYSYREITSSFIKEVLLWLYH